jgi:hypothetical protein
MSAFALPDLKEGLELDSTNPRTQRGDARPGVRLLLNCYSASDTVRRSSDSSRQW